MSHIIGNTIVFIIDVILGTYILIVLCRFLFQRLSVDFHNPVSQFILQATSPLLMPMRKYIPSYKGLDTSSLVLAYVLTIIKLFLIWFFAAKGIHLFAAFGFALPDLVDSFLSIFLYAIIIQVIVSWIPNLYGHPLLAILDSLTRPILTPIRRYMPSNMSGIDFTPMAATLVIMVVKLSLVPSLQLFIAALIGVQV